MNTSFDPRSIKISELPYCVHDILRRIERNDIVLNPDFQRQFVWDEIRQSRLIESLLLGVPLPTFYLDASNDERIQVIDGLQRLSTLYAFCQEQSLQLQGLEFLKNLHGKRFDDLSALEQRTIEDTKLEVIAIQPGAPRDVKFLIFRRINTGGVNLTDQEIRHALYEGAARDILRDLAQSEAFIQATNGLVSAKRMEDRECVLRYLAFRLNPYATLNPAQVDTFSFDELLNQTMEELNQATPIMREQYADDFRDSMQKAQLVFGELAFREIRDQHETGEFRKGLFDVWSILLRPFSQEQLQQSTLRNSIEKANIVLMSTDPAFLAAIQPGANDYQSIQTRFGAVEQLLQELI